MSAWIENPISLSDASARGAHFEGQLDAAQLPRLSALVAQSVEDAVRGESAPVKAKVALEFSPHTKPAFTAVSGQVDAQFGLICQRCLEMAPMSVSVDVAFALCETDSPDDFLDGVSPQLTRWDHSGDEFRIAEFVDELVLLELPLVVMHEDEADCGKLAAEARFADNGQDVQTPFAELATLLASKTS
ncbi:MAG: YceD family protein [Pseudomonadota bacterium]